MEGEKMTAQEIRERMLEQQKRKDILEKDIQELDIQLKMLEAKERITNLEANLKDCHKLIGELRLQIDQKDKALQIQIDERIKLVNRLRDCGIGFHSWKEVNGKLICIYCQRKYNRECQHIFETSERGYARCQICSKTYNWCTICHKLKEESGRCDCDQQATCSAPKKEHIGETRCKDCGLPQSVWNVNTECRPTTIE